MDNTDTHYSGLKRQLFKVSISIRRFISIVRLCTGSVFSIERNRSSYNPLNSVLARLLSIYVTNLSVCKFVLV